MASFFRLVGRARSADPATSWTDLMRSTDGSDTVGGSTGQRRRTLPLYLHIVALLALITGLTSLALGLVANRGTGELVDEAVTAAFAGSAELSVQELGRLRNTAKATAEALAAAPISTTTSREARRQRLDSLAIAIGAAPGISAAYVGWPDGEFVLLRPVAGNQARLQAPAGAVWLLQWAGPQGPSFEFLDRSLGLVERRDSVDYAFDPRRRPWYVDAMSRSDTIVTTPYVFFTTLEPGITAARRSPGGAVAGVDVSLLELSRRLPAGRPAPSAVSAVLDPQGHLLGYSDPARLEAVFEAYGRGRTPARSERLPQAADLGSPVIEALAQRIASSPGAFSGTIEAAGKVWRAIITPLEPDGPALVMAAPLDELGAGPQRIRTRMLWIFALAVLCVLPLAWFAARALARPVESFAREARQVARLDFSAPPETPTRVAELDALEHAIGTMRAGLGAFTAVATALVEDDDSERVLNRTLDALIAASSPACGVAWIVDEAGCLQAIAIRMPRGGAPAADALADSALARRIGDADAPLVLGSAAGDTALDDAVRADPLLARLPHPCPVLGIPLRTRDGALLGVIAIVCERLDSLSSPPSTLALAQAIGRSVSIALDRRRLAAAAEAHMQQLHLLETALSSVNDIVLVTDAPVSLEDPEPRIVYANEAFVTHTGYRRDEVLGRRLGFLHGPGTDRRQLERIAQAQLRQEPIRAELANFTKEGQTLWLEVDIAPIHDASGAVTHWVSVERDITQRKAAQAQAQISDERFRLVASATNDVIRDWDLREGRVWWNEGLQALFGYDATTAGSDIAFWQNRIHPEDRARVLARVEATCVGRARAWMEEYRFRRADGAYATVIDRGHAVRDERGETVRILGSMIDVTERRALDDRLRQSQKLEAVGQLTGGVAHDFNNLLTVIIGNAAELEQRLAGHPQEQALAQMTVRAAERGAELTARLLAFARRQTLEPRIIDLDRLLVRLQGLLERALTENVEIVLDCQPGLWPARIDPGQLEVALLNLALNARDAMPQGGRLTLSCENIRFTEESATPATDMPAGEYVVIRVRDTGTGMPPEVLEHAFDPFFTTKESGKGSGLGLSMVYGFIRQSQGYVLLDSQLGRGSTVSLYLPRAAGVAEQESAAGVPPRDRSGSEHILLVEDDRLVREHVVAQLLSLGYRVSSAQSGAQALELLQLHPDIALLFTDIVMPGGINGVELATRVHAMRPDLRILFTSGYADDSPDGLIAGAMLLRKPYRRQDLATMLRRMLEARPAGMDSDT